MPSATISLPLAPLEGHLFFPGGRARGADATTTECQTAAPQSTTSQPTGEAPVTIRARAAALSPYASQPVKRRSKRCRRYRP